MTSRITDRSALMGAVQATLEYSAHLKKTSIEPSLQELVKIRASQINGCSFCLAMHIRDALYAGERIDRIAVLDAWREAPWFSDRERAALAWTEAVTTLENRQVPDEVFVLAREQFSEKELADLTLVVTVINSWNRLNVAFHTEPEAFDFPAATAQAREAAD